MKDSLKFVRFGSVSVKLFLAFLRNFNAHSHIGKTECFDQLNPWELVYRLMDAKESNELQVIVTPYMIQANVHFKKS
jgi:hypothetical protein